MHLKITFHFKVSKPSTFIINVIIHPFKLLLHLYLTQQNFVEYKWQKNAKQNLVDKLKWICAMNTKMT